MTTSTDNLCTECENDEITHESTQMCDWCHAYWVKFYEDLERNQEREARRRRGVERRARFADEYAKQPQAAGFMVVHTRATDRLFFGPFPDLYAIDRWFEEVGNDAGVSGSIVPLMNPHQDPQDFWWIPPDTPWQDLLLPRSERTDI